MQLIERIAAKLSTDKISVLKLSNETGISAYKIYKWIDKKGSPKHEDSIILEKWLNGNLEKVPHETNGVTKQSYTIEYIELLKKQNIALEDRCSKLENELLVNLKKSQENQNLNRDLILILTTHVVNQFAGKDKIKALSDIDIIVKRIAALHH